MKSKRFETNNTKNAEPHKHEQRTEPTKKKKQSEHKNINARWKKVKLWRVRAQECVWVCGSHEWNANHKNKHFNYRLSWRSKIYENCCTRARRRRIASKQAQVVLLNGNTVVAREWKQRQTIIVVISVTPFERIKKNNKRIHTNPHIEREQQVKH